MLAVFYSRVEYYQHEVPDLKKNTVIKRTRNKTYLSPTVGILCK